LPIGISSPYNSLFGTLNQLIFNCQILDMKVVFFGTPQFAVPTLEALLQHPDVEVIGVVSQPDKKRGRGNQMIPSAVKKVALERNLPVFTPKSVKKHRETLEKLKNMNADVFVVVAYGQILSSEILQMPKFGCINVHGSILPKYRGAAPIQWSLFHGDRETGVTTMLMNEGLDTGDMLLKSFTKINLLDNADQLALDLSQQGAKLLIETLEKIQEITPIPQDNSQANYAPLIGKSDFQINWLNSAQQIHNQVRAFYPHCLTKFRSQDLKILATIPLGEEYFLDFPREFDNLKQRWPELMSLSGQPGEILFNLKKFGPVIQTGEGLLLLLEIQLAGKKPQSGWDFVNGKRLNLGEIFGQ
jgi:methionyl-tRNA formyltransferase